MVSPGDTGRVLNFLSWNLAMLERSAAAPLFWDASATEAAVREEVLSFEPDLVLYQELPGLVPFVETHVMVPANPRSHSGNLATLVSQDLAEGGLYPTTVDRCALLTTFEALDLTVANVHLAPGKGAAPDRMMQISQIIQASPTDALVIIGDTNMRLVEADQLVEMGFNGDKPPSVTWDSRRNQFRRDMPEFSAYFTRWFASPGISVTDVQVHNQPIDHDGVEFFVSDHFAMSGTITLENDEAE